MNNFKKSPLETQKERYEQELHEVPKIPALTSILENKIRGMVQKYQCPDSWVVDIGGLNGQMTRTLHALIVDISEKALVIAQGRNLKAVCADMHHLPFHNNSLQSILFCHSLEHSPEPLCALKEAYRALAGNGYLFLAIPNASSCGQIIKLLFHGQVKPSGNPPLSQVLHYHQYTLRNVQSLLSSTGFKIITVTGDYAYFPFSQKMKLYKIMNYLGSLFPGFSESLLLAAQKVHDGTKT